MSSEFVNQSFSELVYIVWSDFFWELAYDFFGDTIMTLVLYQNYFALMWVIYIEFFVINEE